MSIPKWQTRAAQLTEEHLDILALLNVREIASTSELVHNLNIPLGKVKILLKELRAWRFVKGNGEIGWSQADWLGIIQQEAEKWG
jgi:hypothetical protein